MSVISANPKYRQLRDVLAAAIADKRYKPGDQLPPERTLMTQYGVSYATVTRALHELRATGLIERQWGKGTFIAKPHTNNLSIALTFDSTFQMSHPQMVRILRGISLALEAKPTWALQIYPVAGGRIFSQGADPLFLRMLKERALAGMLCCSAHPPEDMLQLQHLGIPTVTINNHYPRTGIPCALSDRNMGARQVVACLADLGHRRIGVVSGRAPEKSTRMIRGGTTFLNSFLDELSKRSLPHGDDLVAFSDYTWNSVAPRMRRWLTAKDRPTAIIMFEDHPARELIRLAGQAGLRVPQDLSVIGAGDYLEASTLTTIVSPQEDIGRMSIQMLADLMAGRRPADLYLPEKLIIRQTTAPAPQSVKRGVLPKKS